MTTPKTPVIDPCAKVASKPPPRVAYTIKIKPSVIAGLKTQAALTNRSFNNLIESILVDYLRDKTPRWD